MFSSHLQEKTRRDVLKLGAMAGPAEWAGADGVKLVSAAIAGGPD